MKSKRGDVHVMPNNEKHIDSSECPCGPVPDEATRQRNGSEGKQLWIHTTVTQ